MTPRTEETIVAATVAILAEGIAVMMFFASAFVWLVIGATEPVVMTALQ
jgi:hypothetical protein